MKTIVFTDGASRGNPGPGGWGTLIVTSTGKVTELGGAEPETTNNRMELTAARKALEYIIDRKIEGDIAVYTDSAYLISGVESWVYAWEKNGWKTKTGEDVLNQDIWRELLAVTFREKRKREISWLKVEGHTGLRGNERADEIATSFASGAPALLFIGPQPSYEKLIGGTLFDETGTGREKKTRNKTPAYSYISQVGTLIEIHKTWKECEARVRGKSHAKYKKSISKEDEMEIITSWSGIKNTI